MGMILRSVLFGVVPYPYCSVRATEASMMVTALYVTLKEMALRVRRPRSQFASPKPNPKTNKSLSGQVVMLGILIFLTITGASDSLQARILQHAELFFFFYGLAIIYTTQCHVQSDTVWIGEPSS